MQNIAVPIMLLVIVSTAFAGPGERLNFGSQINAAQCTPGAGKLAINVVLHVVNDADSGFHGYWAMDDYTKTIQVWDKGDGSFCASVKYIGSWVTVAGNSPGAGLSLNAGITGTMEGGYTATITGALKPTSLLDQRTKGFIGTKDYGCTISGGAASNCNPFDWVGAYFNAGATFDYNTFWGWIYHGGDNGTWVNAVNVAEADSGDIHN